MKDEFKGRIINEFIRLKSKMYSLINVDDEEITKPKGLNKKLRHKEFAVLFNKKVIRHNMKRIQRKLHRIGAYNICKISSHCFDDKIYILDDGINSLAYKSLCIVEFLGVIKTIKSQQKVMFIFLSSILIEEARTKISYILLKCTLKKIEKIKLLFIQTSANFLHI